MTSELLTASNPSLCDQPSNDLNYTSRAESKETMLGKTRSRRRCHLTIAAVFVVSAAIAAAGCAAGWFLRSLSSSTTSITSYHRVIVTLQPGASLAEALANFSTSGRVRNSFVLRGGAMAVLELDDGARESAMAELQANPLVRLAEEDQWLSVDRKGGLRDTDTPYGSGGVGEDVLRGDSNGRAADDGGRDAPNDTGYPFQWNLHRIGLQAGQFDEGVAGAWAATTGSREVKVCVVDGGVDYTHPDLAANMWRNPGEIPGNGIDDDGNGFVDDIHGYNFADGIADPMERANSGHGTHVAGILGAVSDNGLGVAGVAPQVSIIACKFLRDESGTGRVSDAIRCLDYCQAMGAHITTGSAGDPSGSASFQMAVEASTQDVLFVCSAGNNAIDVDVVGHYPARFHIPNLLAVAGSSPKSPLADWANWGATSIDIAAPGEDIWSTFPGNTYRSMLGSSMAVPHVSGAAALLLSMDPDLSVPEVKALLLASALPSPYLQGKVASGGHLHIGRAVAALRPLVEYFAPGEAFDLEGHIMLLTPAPAGRGFLGCVARGIDGLPVNPEGGARLPMGETSASATLRLTHAFPLAGRNVDTVTVHRNGVISFGEDRASTASPSVMAAPRSARLFAFWAELSQPRDSEVSVKQSSERTVVTYLRMGLGSAGRVSFQVALRHDGSATVAWTEVDATEAAAVRVLVGASATSDASPAALLTFNTADFSSMTSCWGQLDWLARPPPLQMFQSRAEAVQKLSNRTVCYRETTTGVADLDSGVRGCVDSEAAASGLTLPVDPGGGLTTPILLPDSESIVRIELLDSRTYPFAGQRHAAVFVDGRGVVSFSSRQSVTSTTPADSTDGGRILIGELLAQPAVAILASRSWAPAALAVDYKQLSFALVITLYVGGSVIGQASLRWDGSLCVSYPNLQPLLPSSSSLTLLAGASNGLSKAFDASVPFWQSDISRMSSCEPLPIAETRKPVTAIPAQLFKPGELFDLSSRTLRFVPIGTSAMGVCIEPGIATGFPVDSRAGQSASSGLGKRHSAVRMSLGNSGGSFPFLGLAYDSIVLASDGYVAFDSAVAEPLLREDLLHRTRRISAIFSALDVSSAPSDGGVSVLQRLDSTVITFDAVPSLVDGTSLGTGNASSNSFQLAMHRDGRIDLTFLQVDARSASMRAVGVSGGAVPPGWQQSDLSKSPLCQPTVLQVFSGQSTRPFGFAFSTLTLTPLSLDSSSVGVDNWRLCVRDHPRSAVSPPPAATPRNLGDDDSVLVVFKTGVAFPFFGTRYRAVHVGSNGYLTFDQRDVSVVASAADHFAVKRISVFAADLVPQGFSGLYGGLWVSYGDGGKPGTVVVITYQDVELYHQPGTRVSFQVELREDGGIVLSYGEVGTPELLPSLIVGLSNGEPMSATWQPIDMLSDEYLHRGSDENGVCR